LNGDGVDEGSDVQGPQDGAAACHHPAKQHPTAPQQVQEQDGLHEEENGDSASNAIMLSCLPYRKPDARDGHRVIRVPSITERYRLAGHRKPHR